MRRNLLCLAPLLLLQGCLAAAAVGGAAATVVGAAVGTAGAVVGGAVDVVTPDDDEDADRGAERSR